MKTAVVYRSKHGSAGQYARWIAEDTGADIYNERKIRPKDLDSYDIIIFGGGIYTGGIKGIDFVRKNVRRRFRDKIVIVYAVGISIDDAANRQQAYELNFEKMKEKPVCFFFPGAFRPEEIKGLDKKLIGLTKSMIAKGVGGDFGNTLLGYFRNGCDLLDRERIRPLVELVRALSEEGAPVDVLYQDALARMPVQEF
jgi:flavodoxin